MGKELLLEIGTEEIPAAFLPKALKDMEEIIRKELAESRILHGEIRTMGTPRRLFLTVADVAERQEDQVIEKLGPACRVAFDAQGNPSPAALGFAADRESMYPLWRRRPPKRGSISAPVRKSSVKRRKACSPRSLRRLITGHPLPQIDALVRSGVPLRTADSLAAGPVRRQDRPFQDRQYRKRQCQPWSPIHESRILSRRKPRELPRRDAEPFRYRRSLGKEEDHPRGNRQSCGSRRRQCPAE